MRYRWAGVLAPYIAVGLGLYVLRNGWASILIYHALVLLWLLRMEGKGGGGMSGAPAGWSWAGAAWLVWPMLATGPAVWFLLPWMLRTDVALAAWLREYGLGGMRFLVFVIYFGTIHPLLEEIHWGRLRGEGKAGWLFHAAFAGYHVPVVCLVIGPVWALVAFVVLAGMSRVWAGARRRYGGDLIPALSHGLADLCIMGAVYARQV